jgi:hypothetical protein
LFPQNTTTLAHGILNIERSHDASGNDTTSGQYATQTVIGSTSVTNTFVLSQISISSAGNATVNETKLPCISQHTTATGSFGLSTLLSPIFPVVGAVGNPLIGALVGKSADWADLTQFSFTIYSVAHNFIIMNTSGGTAPINGAGTLTYDGTPTCCVAMRYE